MSERIFVTPTSETVLYGDVRRRPAEYEEQPDGTQILKRKANIFMLREIKGKDKNNKPITLTVEMQLKTLGDTVRRVNIDQADIQAVQAAKFEAQQIDTFEEQQKELDEIKTATAIVTAQDEGMTENEATRAALADNVNPVDEAALNADIAESIQVKTEAELAAEASGSDPVVEAAPEVPAVDASGTGDREVI